MWFATVQPAIAELAGGGQLIRHREIKCFGMGESHLEQQIGNLVERGREPSVGITVHEGTITLRITARDESEAACTKAIDPVERTIRERLGEVVMGIGNIDIANVIAELLESQGKTLAVVEYGTEGWLTQELAKASAGRTWFRGGIVSPTRDVLHRLSDMDGDLQNAVALSADDVAKLAQRCRSAFGADFALAIGRFFATKDGDAPDRAQMALAHPDAVEIQKARLATHPAVRAPIAAKQLLNMLRLKLLEQAK